MRSKIIMDYLCAWRWGRIKAAAARNNGWFAVVYLLLFLPCMLLSFSSDIRLWLQYYACILPLLWNLSEAELLPLGLAKIQYLCPMTADERKKYLLSMYWLKVILPAVLFFILQVICAYLGWIHPAVILMGTFMCFLLSMVFQLNPRLPMEKGSRFYEFNICQSVIRVIGSVLFVCGSFYTGGGYDKGTQVIFLIVYGVFVLIQFLMTAKAMTYFSEILNALLHYEIVSTKLIRNGDSYD